MLLASALAWLGTGTKEGYILAILLCVFAVMISVFAKEMEKLVHESFLIRHQRDRLVEQLDRERQQVALARDHAEQAYNAKSRFLAAASHDLRQPLHALSLFSATLALHARSHEVRDISDHIGRALSSLTALVNSLLDISKLDARAVSPELQAVDALAVIERVVADYGPAAARKGLDVRIVPCHAVVHTDPMLLDRVLRNLIDNAIKYTARGLVKVAMRPKTDKLQIIVQDSGEGIPEAERQRIFEEFYQIGNSERDRTKGLGLGLAIVKRIAHLIGTEVSLSSEIGRGSRFAFHVPLASSMPVPNACESSPAADGDTLRGRSVIIIDDEPDVRVGMRRLLEAWGCAALVCAGLDDARHLLEEHQPKLDLIVVDFRLRAGESGIEAVEELRRRLGPVPALLVTGDTAPERLKEAEASGLPMLHKPVAPEALRMAMVSAMSVG